MRNIVKFQYTQSQLFFLGDLTVFVVFYVGALFAQFFEKDEDWVLAYQISCFVVMIIHSILEVV